MIDLQEKLKDWNTLTGISQDVHRAMQTGHNLSLELFQKYLKVRRDYETKYDERYHPFIRPIK